jgi:hypothetical protein
MTLGVASAVGGGVLSSVLAIEVPALLRWDQDLYILPALVGAGTVALLNAAGILNGVTAAGAAALALGLDSSPSATAGTRRVRMSAVTPSRVCATSRCRLRSSVRPHPRRVRCPASTTRS